MNDLSRALTLLICLSVMVTAAEGEFWHGDFTGDSTRVFLPDAPLLETADPGSPVIARLPMGITAHVTSSAGDVILPDGTPSYMYEVSASCQGRDLQGYMPYTSLAMASLELRSGLLFMFSVTAYDTSTAFWSGSMRIVDGNEIVASYDFRPPDGGFGQIPYSYCVRALPLDPGGLDQVQDLIQLSFIYEACGFLNRDMLVVWTGDSMFQGPNADSQFEAGIYSYNENFVLPSDSGGMAGTVIVRGTLMEWDESIEDYTQSSSTDEIYVWDGTEFIPEQL